MIPLPGLLGESPGMVASQEQVGRLLKRQPDLRRLPPILILGETGTGKGLLARAIHQASSRASGPFVPVNCAAIPETLLEAELFGYERGAFTDARHAKLGLFQAAHRGTIFLDGVGLLPETLQGKLLTVLEERHIRRLGSTRSEPVDVWILAATSTDLEGAVRVRRFGEALYHRLAVLTLKLPPLRERGQDILRLAEHFLVRACEHYNLPPKTLASEARTALVAYPGPGNVRELANLMERVALLTEAPVVTAEMLGLPAAQVGPREPAPGRPVPLKSALESAERERLLEALHQTGWNISRAAEQLGMQRTTLRYRLRKYGLHEGTLRRVHPVDETGARPEPPHPVTPAPSSARIRWDSRHLAFLRATLAGPPGQEAQPDASHLLSAFMDKAQGFGGRVEEIGRTGLVASFGLEPAEDAPRRAVYAALAMRKNAERVLDMDVRRIAIRIGIHAARVPVSRGGTDTTIDADAKRDAAAVLDALVERAEAGAILVSEGAARYLERRFELVPAGRLPRAGAGVPDRRTGTERARNRRPAQPVRGPRQRAGAAAKPSRVRPPWSRADRRDRPRGRGREVPTALRIPADDRGRAHRVSGGCVSLARRHDSLLCGAHPRPEVFQRRGGG